MSEEEIIERLSERIQDSEDVDRIQVFLTNDITAIQGLLDLYKKEKEKNGKLRVELKQQKGTNKAYHDFIMFTGGKDIKDITATEYIKIKQEGYLEGRQEEHQKAEEIIMNNYISKDKIKEIVDENIPKQPNIITGEMEYTPNTNANSFLVQDILKLLEEK